MESQKSIWESLGISEKSKDACPNWAIKLIENLHCKMNHLMDQHMEDLKHDAEITEQGYNEAYNIILRLKNKLENQSIHIHELLLTFGSLEKAMNLPPNVKIVAIKEDRDSKIFNIRLASTQNLPNQNEYSYSTPELSQIGDFFCNPDKYKVSNKGSTRGA